MLVSFIKSALWPIVWKLIKEAGLSLLGKLPASVLAERLLSRLLVWLLSMLKSLSTNELWQSQFDDIIQILIKPELKSLPKISEQVKLLEHKSDGMESNS